MLTGWTAAHGICLMHVGCSMKLLQEIIEMENPYNNMCSFCGLLQYHEVHKLLAVELYVKDARINANFMCASQ